MNKGAVVIPARYESSRFPGKPLVDINGKPMIQHVFEKCAEAVGKDLVYVATDSKLIKLAVEAFGGKVVMTSKNCLTGTDRLAEVNNTLNLDFLVNVQGDEPMICPSHVSDIYKMMKKDCANVLNCFCDIEPEERESPTIPKVVLSSSSKLLYMSRMGVPSDKSLISHAKFKQVCIYGFSRDHLNFFAAQDGKSPNEMYEDIEILRFLDGDIPVQMVEVKKGSVAVDTPDDLIRVRLLMTD